MRGGDQAEINIKYSGLWFLKAQKKNQSSKLTESKDTDYGHLFMHWFCMKFAAPSKPASRGLIVMKIGMKWEFTI